MTTRARKARAPWLTAPGAVARSRVVDAAYCAPYVLAFSDRFYEVRHVETKEVVSIVPFNNFVHLSTHNDLNSSGEILIAVRAILRAVPAR